ncbi:hypothetical protein ACWIF8_01575 [Micromonospora chalcea]|uniref:hypothetical protein n=1 Tax=unclassified Micromonospora TaxID=2617518 RepID=UPI0033B31CBD
MSTGDPRNSRSEDGPDGGKGGREDGARYRGDNNRFNLKNSTVNYHVGNGGPSGGERGALKTTAAVAGIVGAMAAVVGLAIKWFPPDAADGHGASTGQLPAAPAAGGGCAGGASPMPSDSAGAPASGPFEAVVSGTMDVDSDSFVGVISYRDPTLAGKGSDAGHYRECQTVSVVCRIPNGREIKDKPWRNRPPSTSGWYRLAGPTPTWVPDMYLTIRATGGASSVPRCA